jgi:hypothetical protein
MTSLLSRAYGQHVFLDTFPLQVLLHVKVAFCLLKSQKYLLYTCQIFLSGRAHEQIFFVQKLV